MPSVLDRLGVPFPAKELDGGPLAGKGRGGDSITTKQLTYQVGQLNA